MIDDETDLERLRAMEGAFIDWIEREEEFLKSFQEESAYVRSRAECCAGLRGLLAGINAVYGKGQS